MDSMNEKQGLRKAFDKRRRSLEGQLLQISDAGEIVRCLDTELTAIQEYCVGSLHVQEAKVLLHGLDALRAALRSLAAVRGVEALSNPQPTTSKAPLGQVALTAVELVLLAMLVVAPVGIPLFIRVPIFLVVLLLLIELGFQLIGQTEGRNGAWGWLLAIFGVCLPKPAISPAQSSPASGLVVVDGPAFCDRIAAALSEIDAVVDAAAAAVHLSDPGSNSFASERPVLEFLQELLAAALTDDSITALKKARSVPGLLLRHGVKALSHHEVDISKRAEFFEVFPNSDPATTQLLTERPAFIVGEKVVLRGRVLEPLIQ